MDAQDRLFWKDKACPAYHYLTMSWIALVLIYYIKLPSIGNVLFLFVMHHQAKMSQHVIADSYVVIVELECALTGNHLHVLAIFWYLQAGQKVEQQHCINMQCRLRCAEHYAQDHANGNRPVERYWHQHLMAQLPSRHQQPRSKLQ